METEKRHHPWFCLRSLPRQEHIAAASLKAFPGVEVFSPRLRIRRSTRRGMVWFVESLFPGYLFARFPKELTRAVQSARGVASLVTFGDSPSMVPHAIIADLQQSVQNQEELILEPAIEVGREVCLHHRFFSGSKAVVVNILSSRERVRVLLEFLGQEMSVELDAEAVVPLAEHPLAI